MTPTTEYCSPLSWMLRSMIARRGVARNKRTSENWIHSKHSEEAGCHHRAFDPLWTIAGRHASLPAARRRYVGEDMILRGPIQVVSRRSVPSLRAFVGLRNLHNAIRFRIWKRMQQHLIDDTEDRRGAADAERQGNDGDRGEPWVLD